MLGLRIRVRIWIRKIRMSLGLPDPHLDPLVTSTALAPDLDPSTLHHYAKKISKKTLISTVL